MVAWAFLNSRSGPPVVMKAAANRGQGKLTVTWRPGRYSGFGNQKLLYAYALRLARITGWKMAPPDFRFRCREHEDPPGYHHHIGDLFDLEHWEHDSLFDFDYYKGNANFDALPKLRLPTSSSDTWDQLLSETDTSRGVVQISESELWDWGISWAIAGRWSEDSYFLHGPVWDDGVATLFRTPTAHWASVIEKHWQNKSTVKMSSIVGVHVRVHAIFKQRICTQPLNRIRELFGPYVCDIEHGFQAVVDAVEQAELGLDGPLFLATDKPSAPLVAQLKEQYAGRLQLVGFPLAIKEKCLEPYMDSIILTRAGTFAGNAYSSFSASIASARGDHVWFFRHSTSMHDRPFWLKCSWLGAVLMGALLWLGCVRGGFRVASTADRLVAWGVVVVLLLVPMALPSAEPTALVAHFSTNFNNLWFNAAYTLYLSMGGALLAVWIACCGGISKLGWCTRALTNLFERLVRKPVEGHRYERVPQVEITINKLDVEGGLVKKGDLGFGKGKNSRC
jgi:hypothetical protein